MNILDFFSRLDSGHIASGILIKLISFLFSKLFEIGKKAPIAHGKNSPKRRDKMLKQKSK